MRRILLSALALSALTSAAVAQPVALGDAQLDKIKAGEATATATSCVNGSCQTITSTGPVAVVVCRNDGSCEIIR